MKFIYSGFAIWLSFVLSACLRAQDSQSAPPPPPTTSYPASGTSSSTLNHAEIGVFADYFRFAPSNTTTNFVGVGGRIGFNMNPLVALEAEANYDFARNYTSASKSGSGGGVSTSFTRSNVRPITALFGPKLQFGTSGPFRAFLTGKVGFVDFSYSNSSVVNGSTVSSAVSSIGGSGTHVAFYPGGGIEAFGGPIGIRAEVGDEIYLNNGTFNNIRVTVGPVLRF